MRKIQWLIAILACVLLISGCGGKEDKNENIDPAKPDSDQTQKEDNDADEVLGSDALSVQKQSDGSWDVTVNIPDAAGQEVSILVLSDKNAISNWTSDEVLAIEQTVLDAHGKAELSITPRSSAYYCLVVTYNGGSEILEIK